MNSFNIRVYGLLINEQKEVLLSDEERNEFQFTKFPGGGLDWGEGIHDALKREFKEELNLEITIKELFYLTDFFQVSAFNPKDQLISIYYRVTCDSFESIKVNREKIFTAKNESHRWIKINELNPSEMTFPIDQLVAKKLLQH